MKHSDYYYMYNIAIRAINVYAKALELIVNDVSKISAQYNVVNKDEIRDYYIELAEKQVLKEKDL